MFLLKACHFCIIAVVLASFMGTLEARKSHHKSTVLTQLSSEIKAASKADPAPTGSLAGASASAPVSTAVSLTHMSIPTPIVLDGGMIANAGPLPPSSSKHPWQHAHTASTQSALHLQHALDALDYNPNRDGGSAVMSMYAGLNGPNVGSVLKNSGLPDDSTQLDARELNALGLSGDQTIPGGVDDRTPLNNADVVGLFDAYNPEAHPLHPNNNHVNSPLGHPGYASNFPSPTAIHSFSGTLHASEPTDLQKIGQDEESLKLNKLAVHEQEEQLSAQREQLEDFEESINEQIEQAKETIEDNETTLAENKESVDEAEAELKADVKSYMEKLDSNSGSGGSASGSGSASSDELRDIIEEWNSVHDIDIYEDESNSEDDSELEGESEDMSEDEREGESVVDDTSSQ